MIFIRDMGCQVINYCNLFRATQWKKLKLQIFITICTTRSPTNWNHWGHRKLLRRNKNDMRKYRRRLKGKSYEDKKKRGRKRKRKLKESRMFYYWIIWSTKGRNCIYSETKNFLWTNTLGLSKRYLTFFYLPQELLGYSFSKIFIKISKVSDFPSKNLLLVKAIKQKYATGRFCDSNTHFDNLNERSSLPIKTKDPIFWSAAQYQYVTCFALLT